MSDITLLELTRRVSQALGDYQTGTTTGDGDAGKTYCLDGALAYEFASNDAIKGRWHKLTSGAAAGDVRLIKAFTQSTGKIEPVAAYSAQVLTGVTHEIHRIRPTEKTNAVNAALRKAWPQFCKRYDNWDLVTGGWLPHDSFQNYTSAIPTWWSQTGGTFSVATTPYRRVGTYSEKCIGGAGTGVTSLLASAYAPLMALAGKTVTWTKYVSCSAASGARLFVVEWVGGIPTRTNGAYHSGGGGWEPITVTRAFPAAATGLQFSIEVANAVTAYIADGYCTGPDLRELVLPAGEMEVVTEVWLGNDWQEYDKRDIQRLENVEVVRRGSQWYLRFHGTLPPVGRRLRVSGYGPIPALAADSDTVDLDQAQADVIVEGAVAELLLSGSALRDVDRKQAISEGLARRSNFERGKLEHQMVTGAYMPNLDKDVNYG